MTMTNGPRGAKHEPYCWPVRWSDRPLVRLLGHILRFGRGDSTAWPLLSVVFIQVNRGSSSPPKGPFQALRGPSQSQASLKQTL